MIPESGVGIGLILYTSSWSGMSPSLSGLLEPSISLACLPFFFGFFVPIHSSVRSSHCMSNHLRVHYPPSTSAFPLPFPHHITRHHSTLPQVRHSRSRNNGHSIPHPPHKPCGISIDQATQHDTTRHNESKEERRGKTLFRIIKKRRKKKERKKKKKQHTKCHTIPIIIPLSSLIPFKV